MITEKDLIKINKTLGEKGTPKDPKSGISGVLASHHYYDDTKEKVLSIAISIAHGHPFENGNKRTALTIIRAFSDHYGWGLVSDDNQYKIIQEIAAKGGKPSKYLKVFK